ncbi:TPA: hypothetical protein I7243_17860 [Vibrio vulnificus]|nr:hypothetical protein [Vibrio vulnificus]
MAIHFQSKPLEQARLNLSHDDLFEHQTNLFEIKLKDNFPSFAKDRGFGFASFCSNLITTDIFVPHKVTEHIFRTVIDFSSSLWAEISCKKECGNYKYRIERLWKSIDDVLKDAKQPYIIQAATSIKKFETKYPSYKEKIDTDTNTQNGLCIFTYDEFLSPQKQQQLEARLIRIGNPDKGWDLHNTIAYTYAEYFVEYWAKQHQLTVLDYNETNQFAPQDYNIDGKAIDVKSVIGVGRRKGTQYSSFTDGNEVLIGVCTHTHNLNDDMIELSIDGVFDPKNHQNIDLALNYLKLNTSPNICYFSSLYDYFLSPDNKELTSLAINTSLLLYAANMNAVPLLLQLCSENDRDNLLKRLITRPNYKLIPIILELFIKDKAELFPHYLADYVIQQTVQKQILDTANIEQLLGLITIMSQRQQRFILDLLQANNTLEKVRCHWHPQETIADMGIDIYYSDTSSVPTLRAVCSCNPRLKTTFFTYSWKTNETLCYESDNDICDLNTCGCLLHAYQDYNLGRIKLGKSTCLKYGKHCYETWLRTHSYTFSG